MTMQERMGYWVQWVFLSGIGWFGGFVLGSWVGGYIGVSLAQWSTLRIVLTRANRWLAYTIIGIIVG
jgi:hypothetical protein